MTTCCCCDRGDVPLYRAPLMAPEPDRVVCYDCYEAWYDTGITDREELAIEVARRRSGTPAPEVQP